MTQLRKWILTATTALILAVPMLATAPTARADSVSDAIGHTRQYNVFAREDPNEPWVLVAQCDTAADAQQVAAYLRDLGFEAFIR